MKIIPLMACMVILASTAFAAGPQQLAFEKNNEVWVAKINGAGARKISRGQSPELSPDGKKLAFNTLQADGKPAHRQIAVTDLVAWKTTYLASIPSDNCMEATWSPDGKRLLFYYYVKNQMCIGLVNADGSGFRQVRSLFGKHKDYWAAAWAPDGKSFYAEDMESLYLLDLGGKVLKQWKVDQLVPQGSMGGDVRMHASADGRTLLMDIEMNEKERKGWDGPPPAIWALDLATEKATRITPKTLYAWDSNWCGSSAVVFASEAVGAKSPSIYRMPVQGRGTPQLLVKDARMPSVAP